MVPLLIAGALVGLGAHACASVDNEEAYETNQYANEIIDESNQIVEEAKSVCQSSMDELAKEKAKVLQENMKRFVISFSKIKPVNFTDSGDLFEIAKFNRNELMSMQSMVSSVQKVNINEIVGDASGVALAVGAADILAGGTLLGGAGISIGGLAGGAALGAVAAPIFAITGIFSASEASENLEKAKSNLSKAQAYQDEAETYSYLAYAVSERCDLFYQALSKLNTTWFTDAVNQLEILVNSKKTIGNFFRNISGKKIYNRQEIQMIASTAALAKMIKTVIDTNILDDSGQVSGESEKILCEIQDKIENEDLSVKLPDQEVLYQREQIRQADVYVKSENKLELSHQENPNSKDNIVMAIYNPNKFVKFIMWLHVIFYGFCGICIILGGSFISGTVLFASGLMMCPKINKSMKFWSRFGLMCLLIVISVFFI